MNMDVAAVPAPVRERRPAGERNHEPAVAQIGGGDLALCYDKLIAPDDLVAERERFRIQGEVSIDIRESLGLETNVALLRLGLEFRGMAEGDDVVAASVREPHPGRNGGAGLLLDNPALNRIAGLRSGVACACSKQRARGGILKKAPTIRIRHVCRV